jgi:DNA-binding NtrC family response regulator
VKINLDLIGARAMAYTILVVDDKDLIRRNLRIFFEQFGDTVHEASTGEAALKLMKEASFDIVISDLRLPGIINGLDVLNHCAKSRPGSGLVLITAFGSDDVRLEAEQLGALYYEKPITLDKLREGIKAFTPSA